MDIVIREAVKDDLADILQLYAQPDMDNGRVLSLQQAQEIFARMSGYPNYKVYVAAEGGEIVGTFALAVMDNLAHLGAPSSLIEDVVVRADQQGKGIGKRMMDFAIERCKEQGCYKVALSSNLKRVGAHRFYESLGFQRHGISFVVEP